jgi:pimeloyl-ACP methyl ester carboxylesterase
MPKFSRDGVDFHYREMGHGLPFVFQHGLGGDVHQPFGLLTPPAGYRMISLDFRAHGETRPVGPPAKLAIAALADDVCALLDHLKLRQAIVGGISLGAAVALNLALRAPERVLGLILSRPAWLDAPFPENTRIYPKIAALIRDHGTAKGVELFRATPDYRAIQAESPDAARSLIGQFENARAQEAVERLERIPRDAPCVDRAAWQKINVPTLVLANRQDPIHPYEYGEILARSIPRAEFAELTPKSVSIDDHAADVERFIIAFLEARFPARTRSPC